MIQTRQLWDRVERRETRRLLLISVLYGLVLTVLVVRIASIQIVNREPWVSLGLQQYEKRIPLLSNRGIVYDRNKEPLAMDFPVTALALDPGCAKDQAPQTAGFLAKVLGGSSETYMGILRENRDRGFVPLRDILTDDQRLSIVDSRHPALILVPTRTRVHPFGSLGYSVLGITNASHHGVGGVEQAMDDVLSGQDGWIIHQRDAHEQAFPSLDYPKKTPENGRHVVLTLNHPLQAIVEEELHNGVVQFMAKNGCAVLMDPSNGDVLSMASDPGTGSPEFEDRIRNLAVQSVFEPGSTFKMVVAASALEEQVVKPSDLVFCENGTFALSGRMTVHDHGESYGWLTVSQVMEVSSNIGMVKIATKLGKNRLYRFIQNFGLGSVTGIGIPGEASGRIPDLYEWNESTLASAAFGQGLSVSPLQLAIVVSAVANGGELYKPRLIMSVIDESGKEVETFPIQRIRRVISRETAAEMADIMVRVVENGSGVAGSVTGVRIAGKTGTSQKSVPGSPGYRLGAYVSSFVGYWPVDDPQFVLVVVLDEPRKEYWGAKSAAPVFARMVTRIMGLPDTRTRAELRPPESEPPNDFAYSNFETMDGKTEEEAPVLPTPEPSDRMPDLKGLSIHEALLRMARYDVEVRVEGREVVVGQEPRPGRRIETGTVCRLIGRQAGVHE